MDHANALRRIADMFEAGEPADELAIILFFLADGIVREEGIKRKLR